MIRMNAHQIESSEDFQVKGSSIRSKLYFAQQCLSPEVCSRLGRWLRGFANSEQILDANWYPFELYDGLLRTLAMEAYGGDLRRLEEVGIFSAEQALTTVYEVYAIQRDFPMFLRRISALHDRFYSRSKLELVGSGEGFCEIQLSDVSVDFTADIHVASGFYIGAARLMGLDKVSCERRIEGQKALFRLDWLSASRGPEASQ